MTPTWIPCIPGQPARGYFLRGGLAPATSSLVPGGVQVRLADGRTATARTRRPSLDHLDALARQLGAL